MSDLPLKLDALTFDVFEIVAGPDGQNAKPELFGASFSEQQDRIFETLMSFQDAEDAAPAASTDAMADSTDASAQMLKSAVHMIRAVFRISTPMYQ